MVSARPSLPPCDLPPMTSTPARKPNKWLVTVSITFGTLMGAIDASIVNVAMPHLRGAVGATLQEITWISTGFVIATVLVMPLTAFLGRQFGQKRVYLACLVLFVIGSALCGMARSLWTLVFFRALQGLGAGALQPTEQAILRQTFPPEEQGTAMALFGMAVMLGPAVGPTLGGWIVDNYDWPWIFYINVPVGILGFFMVTSFVQEDEQIRESTRATAELERKHMDWAGIGLMSTGLASLQYFLEEGAADDWFESRTITTVFCIAIIALIGFVWRELTATAPVVNLRLFKDKVFLSGTLISSLMFAMLMTSMFLLPVFMEEMLGFTATQAGMALIPRVLVMMVISPMVGKMYGRVPTRLLVACGVLFFCAGAWLQRGFTLETTQSGIVAAICMQGVGFACLFVPLTATSLASIPRHLMTDATGLNSLLRQMGGSIGLAVFATLLGRYGIQAKASIAAHLDPTRPAVAQRLAQLERAGMLQGLDPTHAHTRAVAMLGGIATRQGMVLAFEKVFLLAGLLFLLVLVLLPFLKTVAPQVGRKIEVHLE